ncbi:TRAP transporter small permease subunit [Roseovarius pelagicus]|uniref:TRAP transporter small permease protein n=1 Tax=Roseovarius pelagicus TaxID=2980108 RepID=A0ABY6DB05_9RHOB|nr:TRAP transporter small permease subunit [Roseovarius pelagicus]UXX83337.1 C4-dicarboxylate ABC transporter permease [Roseovarius pelagicus]
MLEAIVWFFQNIGLAFYNFGYAITHPSLWLDWSDKQAIMRVVYYGGSVEFFFVIFTAFLVLTAVGLWRNGFMWGCVRVLEGFANTVGRLFAWAGLLMVLQQIVIVFVQRIFARPDIAIGFGIPIQMDISWWAEELKLYNALIVCLCCTYTFVQGSHVRVDLIYSAVSFRTKRIIDMVGSLIFMMPTAVLTWMYGWYFMWRHMIVPNPSASDTLDRLLMKARALRWNIETIGFSPNGFNAYFLFKLLLIAFAGMVFLHAIAFFFRSYLEWKEGPESENKYLDKDSLGEGEEAFEGTH